MTDTWRHKKKNKNKNRIFFLSPKWIMAAILNWTRVRHLYNSVNKMRIIAQVDDYKIVVDINWWMGKKGHHLSSLRCQRWSYLNHSPLLDACKKMSKEFPLFFKITNQPYNIKLISLSLQRLFMRCCIHQTWWGNASLGPVYYYYYNRVHPPVTTGTRRPFSKDSAHSVLSIVWFVIEIPSV